MTIGLLSHHGGVSLRGYARDALPFLSCWFGVALVLRLYTRGGLPRLVATWAIAIPLAWLVRALVLGRTLNGHEAAFLVVSLVSIGFLVAAFRLLAWLALRARP
jgi:hypothetical protein